MLARERRLPRVLAHRARADGDRRLSQGVVRLLELLEQRGLELALLEEETDPFGCLRPRKYAVGVGEELVDRPVEPLHGDELTVAVRADREPARNLQVLAQEQA